jgi:excisionase family DNA binding protein
MASDNTPRFAMSVNKAALEANLGRDAVYDAIRDGKLVARKYGRRTLITAEALQAFLNGLPPLQLPPKPDSEPGGSAAPNISKLEAAARARRGYEAA